MPFLDILGYIALAVTWIIALAFAYGIRLRQVGSTTAIQGEILLANALTSLTFARGLDFLFFSLRRLALT